ncbi:MAG TPA: hypothetical protein VN678_10950 [Acidobacteriaceae bacterium]|nr:hypothetical protein [Acidobacteriaceae bacterium]
MPDPTSPDAPTTHLQLIRVVSRLFAAYLLFWAADDLTLLPRVILSLAHEIHNAALAGAPMSLFAASFYLRYYLVDSAGYILRIALLLLAAGWFYRCGPRIHRFFSPETFTSHPS